MQQVSSTGTTIYSSSSEYYDSAVVVWLRTQYHGGEPERARGTHSVLDAIVSKNIQTDMGFLN